MTASALLDLFTGDEVAGFVAACAGAGCPVLVTLSVVGRVALWPADPQDGVVAAAFDDHQRRLTRRGRLLGPDAVAAAAEAFLGHGMRVVQRPSPWQLGATDTALTGEWLAGWLAAAYEQQPELAPDYARRRTAQAAVGALRVTVPHQDLLALPR